MRTTSTIRNDPTFKQACGRLPESGDDLASQPTVSRWENAPDRSTLIRLAKAITLDIDDTAGTEHIRRAQLRTAPGPTIDPLYRAAGVTLPPVFQELPSAETTS